MAATGSAANHYDVVVVGGGIHGVGVAQAATAAGHSVLLLEKSEPAAGTSSRSSKLIHGGLRYLETLQFGLVRESLRERELLLRNAPELVRRVPFWIPVYQGMKRGPWQIRAGLTLYALLGGGRFRTLPRRQWDRLAGLRTEGLRKIFQYQDAQTDDSALTRAVLRSARELGAQSLLPAELLAARRMDAGYVVQFQHESQQHSLQAGVLINAAGPWVNLVQQRIEPAPPRVEVELVQGAHLLLDQALCNGVLYAESPSDGRPVFIMPWAETTLVGTTETRFQGPPEEVRATAEETAYLEEVVQHYFPDSQANTVDSFAGLRVLPAGDGSPNARPRETTLTTDSRDEPRYLAIYGGKLTGYRATAEKVLKTIQPSLSQRRPVANTKELRLS